MKVIKAENSPARARSFSGLAKAAGSLATPITMLDRAMGKRLWPSAPAEFVGVDEDTDEAVVSFGGLGCHNARQKAEEAGRLLSQKVAYLRYSTDGISVKGLAQQLRAQAPRLKRLGINAQSM